MGISTQIESILYKHDSNSLRGQFCVAIFVCSVFSIIRYVTSISNYGLPAWIAKDFLAAFHIVFAVYMCLFTCIFGK